MEKNIVSGSVLKTRVSQLKGTTHIILFSQMDEWRVVMDVLSGDGCMGCGDRCMECGVVWSVEMDVWSVVIDIFHI